MSTQLAALGVEVIEGYEPDQLKLKPDVFVVGNVMSRGNALVEALLDSGARYESGPEWLARNVLHGRWVLGVAGTHGKTTTTSLLAWILEHAGLAPGFLVGGVPLDFNVSARLGARQALRRRGGRVRHGVLRQAREVRALPAAHGDPQQPRARPRRHLPGRRLDPEAVPPAVAHGAVERPPGRQRGRPQPGRGARDGLLDAGRALHRRGRRQRPTGASRPMRPAAMPVSPCGTTTSAASGTSSGTRSAATTRRTRSRHWSPRTTRASTSRPRSKRCAAFRRRAAPARGARHGPGRGGLRRFRASPDRDHDHARGRAAQGARRAASSPCSSRARTP